MDITIVIPTFNGAERLPRLLDHLQHQTNTGTIAWEILVVDNNSTDTTAEVVRALQADWLADVPLRYVTEPRQGAAFARLRGVEVARGELVGFLDDDNLPDSNWVRVAWQFSQRYPQAGAFGGRIDGDYQLAPPVGFEAIAAFLAIRNLGDQPVPYHPDQLQLPPAASLVVRRQPWLDLVPPTPALAGKQPGRLIQGDDYEPLLYLHRAGWEIWYAPDLRTRHQIPSQRLQPDYLLTLARGCGLATYRLRLVNARPHQVPGLFLRNTLGSLKRMARLYLGNRSRLSTDLVTACQWQFNLGALISPWAGLLGTIPPGRSGKPASTAPDAGELLPHNPRTRGGH